MQLVIGNKNYSSWSLRAWFMLKAFDLPFSETRLALFEEGFYSQLAHYTPAGKVPVLIDAAITVWDSLAICEYLNETYLDTAAWPADPAERALARALACEIHSGFFGLRHEMPMNCRAQRQVTPSPAALNDMARIDQMWRAQRQLHTAQGPWLFGEFSIADVMYAPVALRFHTYRPQLSALSQQYVESIVEHPAIAQWIEAARQEVEIIAEEEVGTPR